MKLESTADRLFDWFNRGMLALLLIVIMYPLLYVVSASISDPVLVNTGQMWLLPKGVTLEGYARVFQNGEIWSGYRNTIFYTLLGVAVNLAVIIPCAYAMARKDLAGRNAIMMFMLVTMFFSGGLIPTYLIVKQLGMVNTIWALVIPNAANVWSIIVCRTFFQTSIPREMEEAAEIDGCSNFRLFISIIIPLSAPIIAVIGLFQAVGHWNQYFNAMIYVSNRDLMPLQLILREILVLQEMSETMMSDGSNMEALAEQARIADIIKYAVMNVSVLPLLIVYPFLQRFFVKGVLVGSIKG